LQAAGQTAAGSDFAADGADGDLFAQVDFRSREQYVQEFLAVAFLLAWTEPVQQLGYEPAVEAFAGFIRAAVRRSCLLSFL